MFFFPGEFEAPKYGFPMGAAFKDFETLQGAFTNEGVRATGKTLEVSFYELSFQGNRC